MSAAAGAGVLAVAHARSSFMSGILVDVLAVGWGLRSGRNVSAETSRWFCMMVDDFDISGGESTSAHQNTRRDVI